MQAAQGPHDLRCGQGFVQLEFDTDIYLSLPPGFGSVSRKAVLLDRRLYNLKQSGRSWYILLSSTIVVCDFEQNAW